jgi:uncharacterized protein (DUF4415 family)
MSKSGLSARDKRARKSEPHVPDSEIDFSDIPEATDSELGRAVEERRRRLAGRPPSGKPWRQMISIRLDPQLLRDIRATAKKAEMPYQTWIHDALSELIYGKPKAAAKRKRRA